ncbi:MAG: GntR family transcriptional regulator [Pseudomonadota bacterium]
MFFGKHSDDETVVALIAAALRRDISFGTLRPDAKLKIGQLRTRYGGSNHSVREALRILSSEGLVAAEAQRGFRVASATQADLKDITRLRVEIERLGLGWSIENGGTAWEAEVIAAHHGLRRAEDQVASNADDLTALEWDEAARTFYAALMSGCGSPRLLGMQARLFDQSRRIRLTALRESRVNFTARQTRQAELRDAAVGRDQPTALALLTREIEGELAGT